ARRHQAPNGDSAHAPRAQLVVGEGDPMTNFLGEEDVAIEATLNGKPLKRRVKARRHLADFLRQDMELTGTHLGCEHGICGACTVMIDGRTARGCLTLAAQISGKSVETIEGLTESGKLSQLQSEFIARNAAQCGFCSSGMLLTAYELVASGRNMSRAEIREFISGNMCRCTGYHAIVDAVEAVIAKNAKTSAGGKARHRAAAHAARLRRAQPPSARQACLRGYRGREMRTGRRRGLHGGRYQSKVRAVRRRGATPARAPLGVAASASGGAGGVGGASRWPRGGREARRN